MTAPSTSFATRVGTGAAPLPGLDMRTTQGRRIKEIVGSLVSDLGGDPTEGQFILIQRIAVLTSQLELIEAAVANGERPFSISEFATGANSLNRLLGAIGLERVARDVTPTLDRYIRQTAA